MLGVVAVIVTTLNGLDRVPRVLKQDRADQAARPDRDRAARHAAVLRALSAHRGEARRSPTRFIGVIGSEFIMARSGMGYEIGFAYTNFDNATMYPLILLILLLSIAINGVLSQWEKALLRRRGQR